MTYEELAKAILAMPEEQRKRKAIISNCSLPSELRAEITGFALPLEEEDDPDDFVYLETTNESWR